MNNAKIERNITLDCYKCILAILVVMFHVLQSSVSDQSNILYNIIWAIQMPGFMVVSGYFACRSITSKYQYKVHILKNIKRYFIPLISWFVFVDIIIEKKYNSSIYDGLEILINHVDIGLWFLWVIFVLSIVADTINYFRYHFSGLYKYIYSIVICVLFFAINICVASQYGVKFLGIKYILYYSVFYGLGYFLRLINIDTNDYIRKHESLLVFVCAIIFILIVVNFDLYHIDDNFVGIILRIIAGISGCYFLYNIVKRYQTYLIKLNAPKIGRYTFEIYVTHVHVVGLLNINKLFSLNTIPGLLTFCVAFLFTMVITIVLIAIIKSIPVINQMLFGKS